MIKKNYYLY